jgi:acyl dehydratase
MLGRFYEEHEAGLPAELGSFHFTRESIIAFAQKFDPQPFHLDDAAAAAGPFGALSASGWHTAAGWMKCYVTTSTAARNKMVAAGKVLPPIGPSPGFDNLRWLKPVYPGDTLSYRCAFVAKRKLQSHPAWGLVFGLGEGHNQRGELVFSFESKELTALGEFVIIS